MFDLKKNRILHTVKTISEAKQTQAKSFHQPAPLPQGKIISILEESLASSFRKPLAVRGVFHPQVNDLAIVILVSVDILKVLYHSIVLGSTQP